MVFSVASASIVLKGLVQYSSLMVGTRVYCSQLDLFSEKQLEENKNSIH